MTAQVDPQLDSRSRTQRQPLLCSMLGQSGLAHPCHAVDDDNARPRRSWRVQRRHQQLQLPGPSRYRADLLRDLGRDAHRRGVVCLLRGNLVRPPPRGRRSGPAKERAGNLLDEVHVEPATARQKAPVDSVVRGQLRNVSRPSRAQDPAVYLPVTDPRPGVQQPQPRAQLVERADTFWCRRLLVIPLRTVEHLAWALPSGPEPAATRDRNRSN